MKKNPDQNISCYCPFKEEKDTKWKTKILSQLHTADPVGMGRKSCLYAILKHSVLARLSAHTDWISCVYWAPYPRLPLCGLIYIHTTYSSMTTTHQNMEMSGTRSQSQNPRLPSASWCIFEIKINLIFNNFCQHIQFMQ